MTLTHIPLGETDLIAGRYKVQDLIGQGPASKVYRGVDTSTGETVAIKLLDPSVEAEAPEMLQRFESEGRILAKLSHPSIVTLLTTAEQGGRHSLIMEYVSGGSLKDLLLREPRLPVRRAAEIGLDLADALAHAHEAGVLHRDIKPSNILLADDGTPRLSDFGVALMAGTAMRQGGKGAGGRGGGPSAPPRPCYSARAEHVGTLAYMSPEALRGEELGPESDLWSLGMVLYEMLAGRLPFEGESVETFLAAAADRPAPSVADFRPEVPDELAALTRRMLDSDRRSRATSAQGVGSRLRGILHALVGAKRTPDHVPSLPDYATAFVGREDQLRRIGALLKDPTCRLISLVGPGGIGKSRLAAEVASRVAAEFADGAWFVQLAPVASPDHVVPAIAATMGFCLRGPADPKHQLLDYLRRKKLLLILDSFEHLLEGLDLIAEILQSAPGIKVLVTSQERLSLTGEWTVEIEGLRVPDTEEVADPEEYEAVKLFVQGARRIREGFTLSEPEERFVVRICQLVDGRPLAIELASSWTKVLRCGEIFEEIQRGTDFLVTALRDLPERHRSLRAVFDHSWHLLSESERRAFRRMSVFRGGFTLDGARRVVGVPLALLSALADKSLLRRRTSGRYEVHELLRQYAEERLRELPREHEETQNLHTAYYTDWLGGHEEDLRARRQKEALEEIGEEVENVRAAWTWAVDRRRHQDISMCLQSLHAFYAARSWFHEADEVFRVAAVKLAQDPAPSDELKLVLAKLLARHAAACHSLSRYGDAEKALQGAEDILKAVSGRADGYPPAVTVCLERATILTLEADVCRITGGVEAAEEKATEALVLLSTLAGDRDRTRRAIERAAADATTTLGVVLYAQSDYGAAAERFEESMRVYTKLGDQRGEARASCDLGSVYYRRGDYAKATEYYGRYLSISQQLNDKHGTARASANLGAVYHQRGDYPRAIESYQRCLTVFEELGDRRGVGLASGNLGLAYYVLDDYATAIKFHHRKLRISEELSDRSGIGIASSHLGLAYGALGDFTAALQNHERHMAISEKLGDRQGVSVAARNLGSVCEWLGDLNRAKELHQRSLGISEELGDKQGIALAKCRLGAVHMEAGDYHTAHKLLRAAKALLEEIGNEYQLADLSNLLSELGVRGGYSFEAAAECATEALRLSEQSGVRSLRAAAALNFARVRARQLQWGGGDDDAAELEAKSYFEEAIELYGSLRKRHQRAMAAFEYGTFLGSIGDPRHQEWLDQSERDLKRLGLERKFEQLRTRPR